MAPAVSHRRLLVLLVSLARPVRAEDEITVAASASCHVDLGPLQILERFYDTGDWTASVKLMPWRPGMELTFTFEEPATIVNAGYATVIMQTPRSSTVRIDESSEANGVLLVQGKGGCWGTQTSPTCDTRMLCRDPASPTPPPTRVSTSSRMVIAPRVTGATCSSLHIEWDRPEGHAAVNLEYEVNVIDMLTQLNTPHRTSEIDYTVQHLESEHQYVLQVRTRDVTQGEDWQDGPMVTTRYTTLKDDAVPENLVIVPETSVENCESLELVLPKVPACRHDNDFVSVEWRPAREGERWESLMDRIDEGDLPNDQLIVEHLGSYAAYEFRTLLHHFGPFGSGGTVVTGPSTGALLVGMLDDELLAAPTATATGSASFEIHLPPVSPCRTALQTSVWYASETGHGWRKLQGGGIEREDRLVRANSLRCPGSCRFRLVHDNVLHWIEPSAASSSIITPQLPLPRTTHRRVQLKLASRPVELRRGSSEGWKGLFRDDLAMVLKIDSAGIDVVEVRGGGAFVVFDLPRSNGPLVRDTNTVGGSGATKSPTGALASLLGRPACKANLAVKQPGKCSSSCGNQSSPGAVNDDDLRQYAPHTWVPCRTDRRPWWSVQLPKTLTNPYVRILVGDHGGEDTQAAIEVSIGASSGLGGGMVKCQDLMADKGSVVGTICEGMGAWLTISTRNGAAVSLAEVQVCDLRDANPLLQLSTTSSIDVGAGLLEILDGGSRVVQMAPSLLPFSQLGRDAAWRLPPRPFTLFSPAVGAAVVVAIIVASAIVLLQRKNSLLALSKGPGFSRVSASDGQGKMQMWEDAGSFDDDPLEVRPRHGALPDEDEMKDDEEPVVNRHLTIPVDYERSSDGKTVASTCYISAGTGIERILEQARAGAATTFKLGHVDHVSLQYINKKTGFYEQAWYDPVLGEGSDLAEVLQSSKWRVLVLGSQRSSEDESPSALLGGADMSSDYSSPMPMPMPVPVPVPVPVLPPPTAPRLPPPDGGLSSVAMPEEDIERI